MKTSKKAPAKTSENNDLPPDVVPGDLKYPEWKDRAECCLTSLTFYKTTGLGWVLCTLGIAKATGKRAGRSDRTYAIQISNQKLCRVGFGPHVLKEVNVFLSKKNIKRLQKYIELRDKGLIDANTARDRISSRRAQGQLYRQAGLVSWMWW